MQLKASAEKSAIKFGTDGWRGVIARDFTEDGVARVANAYAEFLHANTAAPPSVIIGYDNRFLSDAFAKCAAHVLRTKNVYVELFAEPVPTPLVSFAVAKQKLSGGIVITASHNAPEYNGFKIKDSKGMSASETTTRAIEALLHNRPLAPIDETSAIPRPDPSIKRKYIEHLSALIDIEWIRDAGLRLVVDSMHGTAGAIIENLLDGGKTQVSTIRSRRDCLFGGLSPEPIDKNLEPLRRSVLQMDAVAGIATDGDADRLGAVNEFGRTMSMHEVAAVLLHHLVQNRAQRGTIVATVTQSVLLRHMAAEYGLPFVEKPVGFKYIAEEMVDGDVLIGAEESGGFGIKGHIPERDGILNGLLFAEALVASGKTPTQLVAAIHKQFGHFSYDRCDLHFEMNRGERFLEHMVRRAPAHLASKRVMQVNTMDGVKFLMADDSWLMFRKSGTEPVLRIYAEGRTREQTAELLQEGSRLVSSFE